MARRCSAQTKAGKRCSRSSVDGERVCVAHLPRKARESKGFGGPQPGSGRPRKPRVVEALREEVERRSAWIVARYVELAGSDDDAVSLRALESLLDRVYGKPRQVTEVAGAGGGPLQVEELLDRKALAKLDGLVDQIAARREG